MGRGDHETREGEACYYGEGFADEGGVVGQREDRRVYSERGGGYHRSTGYSEGTARQEKEKRLLWCGGSPTYSCSLISSPRTYFLLFNVLVNFY